MAVTNTKLKPATDPGRRGRAASGARRASDCGEPSPPLRQGPGDDRGGKLPARRAPRRPLRAALPNLYVGLSAALRGELIETLQAAPGVRIERIISWGQATPPGEWYDQPQSEWVVLLTGAARLRFADAPTPVELGPGDYLNIPAHRRHRVEWTAPKVLTIWLAVHYAT